MKQCIRGVADACLVEFMSVAAVKTPDFSFRFAESRIVCSEKMSEALEKTLWPLSEEWVLRGIKLAGRTLEQWQLTEKGVVTLSSEFVGDVKFPWDLLRVNEQLLGELQESFIEGELSDAAYVDGHLMVGEGTRVLPGVVIEGNVSIGKNCKIGPNCYIRGNTSIGDNVIIGNAVEVKNCIIGSRSAIGHLSYVGDSVIADDVNFGAGTTVSNFRHDAGEHKSMVAGELLPTGRDKFGTIIGEGVRLGIQTAIYPGRKIGSGVKTLPQSCVDRDLGAT